MVTTKKVRELAKKHGVTPESWPSCQPGYVPEEQRGGWSLPTLSCVKCGHTWVPRKPKVYVCPKCKNPRWNEEKP